MAQWKVFKEQIKLFPHPNADKLELGKVGQYQVVVQKGLYEDGDEVIFVPEKSILPDNLAEPFRAYLRGPARNRVGSARLRGELSMGVLISLEDACEATDFVNGVRGASIGEDISTFLDIEKYEPPIPQSMAGQVERLPDGRFTKHDVEQFGIYGHEFDDEEIVIVTEKIHGTQIAVALTDDDFIVTSKGNLGRGVHLVESENNLYWTAVRNTGLEEKMRYLKDKLDGEVLQVFGEVFPAQGGNWTYGAKEPTLRIFDVRIDGEHLEYVVMAVHSIKNMLDLWVPIITQNKFGKLDLNEIRAGKEQVSGEELHIREGVVIRPIIDRRAEDGTRLMVKVINPKYKETGEEFA